MTPRVKFCMEADNKHTHIYRFFGAHIFMLLIINTATKRNSEFVLGTQCL
jgi:hypothetical protein